MSTCIVKGCDREVLARGYCNAHYIRLRTLGDVQADKPLAPMTIKRRAPVEERFWRNVTKGSAEDCWPYGSGAYNGYRSLALGSKLDGTIAVHKYSYELHHGPVPQGMVVMHKCDNPRCVNPAHLEVGSYGENTQDMFSKGRAKPGGSCGPDNPRSKLTEDLVRYIRAHPERGHKDLADEIGVSPNAVRGVRIGRTWTHIK